jgi:hypothetical protein
VKKLAGWQEAEYKSARDAVNQAKRSNASGSDIRKLETDAAAKKATLLESYRRAGVNPPSQYR